MPTITVYRSLLLIVCALTSVLSLSGCGVAGHSDAPAPASSIVGIWRLRSQTNIYPDGTRSDLDVPTTVAQFRDDDTFKINVKSKGTMAGRYVILDEEHVQLDFQSHTGAIDARRVDMTITTTGLTLNFHSPSVRGAQREDIYSRVQ